MSLRSWVLGFALGFAGASVSFAAPCTVSTLQDYLDLTTPCTVGDKEFSDFRYVGVPLVAVAPEDINITPISGPEIGLRFTGPFSVNGLDLVSETFFSFQVATTSGEALINGATLRMGGSFTGLGAISIDENIVFGPLDFASLGVRTSVITTQLEDSATFDPVSSMRVSKDIFVLSGLLGSATIDFIEQTYTQLPGPEIPVPEPGTYALCCTALACVIYGRYRTGRKADTN